MPPTLNDAGLSNRLITWLRVRADGVAQARIQWIGINATEVRQIERVIAEPLMDGDGTPDQTRRLARAPVVPGSVVVTTRVGDTEQRWDEIDDLFAAAPEVPITNPRSPGRTRQAAPAPDAKAEVFELDPESGELRFGDGLRGRRLPLDARVFASYEFSDGARGNVAAGALNSGPQLPAGFTVTNPVQTWGGADAETVLEGEKQIRRYLQHRDRLVSVDDFEAIACRAPGVQIGRVEVLPAFHPDLVPAEPGAAPGVVTVLAIPRFDQGQPDAPRADRLFLNALCRYLDPRRLVTTELVSRARSIRESGSRWGSTWRLGSRSPTSSSASRRGSARRSHQSVRRAASPDRLPCSRPVASIRRGDGRSARRSRVACCWPRLRASKASRRSPMCCSRKATAVRATSSR
jgi:hypothetical protein